MPEPVNPYRSPSMPIAGEAAINNERRKRSGWLTSVMIVSYLFTAINLLGSIYAAWMGIMEWVAEIAWIREHGKSNPVLPFVLLVIFGIAGFLLLMGLTSAKAAYEVQQRRSRGRGWMIFAGGLAVILGAVALLVLGGRWTWSVWTLSFVPYGIFMLIATFYIRAEEFR